MGSKKLKEMIRRPDKRFRWLEMATPEQLAELEEMRDEWHALGPGRRMPIRQIRQIVSEMLNTAVGENSFYRWMRYEER